MMGARTATANEGLQLLHRRQSRAAVCSSNVLRFYQPGTIRSMMIIPM